MTWILFLHKEIVSNGLLRINNQLKRGGTLRCVCKRRDSGGPSGQGLGLFPPATGYYENVRTIFITGL